MAARTTLVGRLIPLDRSIAGALRRALVGALAQRMLLALVGCYLAFGFVASLLMPPWQSPDEPTHFEYARGLALGMKAESPAIERPIIESLYQYRFWDYRPSRIPKIVPESLSAPPLLLLRQTGKTALYYQLAAAVSSWSDDITLQLYSMRWLSILLSACTIPLAYAAARELLPPERSRLALVAGALIAFLPMYGYIGASVNPDNIGAPLGAATIWLIVRGLKGRRPAVMLGCGILCALLAFLARRSAIALVPWALLVAAAWGLGQAARWLPRRLVIAVAAICTAAAIGALAWPSSAPAAWIANGAQSAARTDRYAYEGRYSLHLAGDGSAPVGIRQTLPSAQWRRLAGHTFLFQAVVRSGDTPVTGRIALNRTAFAVSQDDQKQVYVGASEQAATFAATPGWSLLSLPMTLPEGTTGATLILSLAGRGELYVDQIRLLDPATSAPIAIVSNGGAEQAMLWWERQFRDQQIVQYLTRIAQSARDGVYGSSEAFALYPYFLRQLFGSLIGRFGWVAFGPADGLIVCVGVAWLACLIGLALVWRTPRALDRERRSALLWLIVLVLMAVGTILLDYTSFLFAPTFPQGRYLFPILGATTTLLVGGLARLLPARYDRLGVALVVVLLLALDLWSWYGVIVPHFYG